MTNHELGEFSRLSSCFSEEFSLSGEHGVLLGTFPVCAGPSQFVALEVLSSSLSVTATRGLLECGILNWFLNIPQLNKC
jgi:hypothetical protein